MQRDGLVTHEPGSAVLPVAPASEQSIDALARNPAAVYLAGLSAASRRVQRSALARIVDIITGGATQEPVALDWSALRYQHASAVRAVLVGMDLAPATVNRYLGALKSVAREAWKLGQMSADDRDRIGQVERARGSRLPAGRALARGELSAIFSACDAREPGGARDAAMLTLAYAGLRRAEIVALELADYSTEDSRVVVLRGKGNREREAYLAAGGAAVIDRWIDVRGPSPGALICPVTRGGIIELRPMTAQALYRRCAVIASRAGVFAFTPHDLRRTWVGDLLDAGADLVSVQALAGHVDPGTTARYDRRPSATRRRVAAMIAVPG
jgi:integrase